MTGPNTENISTTNDSSGTIIRRKKIEIEKVYVWEIPIRLYHWINGICILLLMITGIYIGNPLVGSPIPEDAYYSYVMGWARYIHFFTAFVFTASLIMRVYWFFRGNKYVKTNPFRKAYWTEMFEVIKFYLFLPNKKKHDVGHNTLAQFSYLIFIGIGSFIMVLTGYYLYFEPQFESVAIGKLALLLGGDSFSVRSLHHIVAWFFIIFTVIHIYMVFRDDWLNRNGTTSSMVTGYKTERKYEKVKKEPKDDRNAQ